MKTTIFLWLYILTGATMLSCHQHAELSKSPFQHFYDEENLVQLVVTTDMANLLAESAEPPYQPAQLALRKKNCTDGHFHLELKPRGVFRRANCTFPPLKIRFPDELLKSAGLSDYPTLKLVTHCEADTAFDQLILKEFLAFQLYRELTDNSLRTQLVRITYCDSEKRQPDFERFGFLIEHPRELADRMKGRILGEEFGAPKSINLPAYKIFTVFQYMIGNTDWGFSNRHNTLFIRPEQDNDPQLPIPVPYDFDFCGLVNAPYAVPHHGHPIANVKERFFQWRGGEEDFSDVFAHFQNKKENLFAIVQECQFLNDSVKTEALQYLDSFYELLKTPELIVGKKNGIVPAN